MAFTPPHGFWNNPPAYMGFVGFVRVNAGIVTGNADGVSDTQHDSYLIRATSADINLTQEISKPDVIDSRYDRSVYQLGPKLVDGSFEFPAVYEVPAGQTSTLFEVLYRYAVTRTDSGLLSPFEMDVKYAASATLPNFSEFKYTGCIANTWKFAVAQSDVVTCTVEVLGVNREKTEALQPPGRSVAVAGCTDSTTETATIGTTRIVTWNDARVELSGGRLTSYIGGQYVRSFEANINNDAERFYTLNTKLFVQAIAPRKREISGNVVLMGRHDELGTIALNNELNCTESADIKFGFNTPGVGEGCSESTFNVTMPNCIFEIEEMSLTNDLFETTVNWHALPAAGTGVCDPMLGTLGSTVFSYEANA